MSTNDYLYVFLFANVWGPVIAFALAVAWFIIYWTIRNDKEQPSIPYDGSDLFIRKKEASKKK